MSYNCENQPSEPLMIYECLNTFDTQECKNKPIENQELDNAGTSTTDKDLLKNIEDDDTKSEKTTHCAKSNFFVSLPMWFRGPGGSRMRILVMDIGLYIGDTFSDVYSGYSHIVLCNYYWAFFTFLCIVLPAIPSLFKLAFKLDAKMRQKFGWRREKLAGGVLWVSFFFVNVLFSWGYLIFGLTAFGISWEYSLVYSLALGSPLFLYHMFRALRAMTFLLMYPPNQKGIIKHPDARKAPRKRFQESFLESSPQCFLQVYILLKDGYKGIFQPLGIILSAISIVKSISESILFFNTNQKRIPGFKAYCCGSLPIITDIFFRILAWSIILNFGPLSGLILFLFMLFVNMFVAAIFSYGFNKSMGFTTFTSYFSPSLYLAEQTKYIAYYRESARMFYLTNKIFIQSSLLVVVTIFFSVTISAGGEGYENGAWLNIPSQHQNISWNEYCSTCKPSMVNSTCFDSCQDLHVSFKESNVTLQQVFTVTLVKKTNIFLAAECMKMCQDELHDEPDLCSQFFSQQIFLPTKIFTTILFPLLIYLYLMSMLDCAQLHYNTGFSNFFLFGVKDDIEEEEVDEIDAKEEKIQSEGDQKITSDDGVLEQLKQLKDELNKVKLEADDLKDQIKRKDARIRIHIKETNDMKKERETEKEEMDMILKQYQKAEENMKNLSVENESLRKCMSQ